MDADESLVVDAVAGSREAFDELVVRYQLRIYNLVRAMSGGGVDADDVTQETFLRAFRAIARFRGESTFRTWLYRIAMNVMKTHQEQRGRRLTLIVSAEPGEHGESAIDRALSSEDLESDVARRDAIDRALADLPENLRAIVTLRDVQGLAYEEIAAVLGIPVGTVESRVFRARQRLRPALAHLVGWSDAGPTAGGCAPGLSRKERGRA